MPLARLADLGRSFAAIAGYRRAPVHFDPYEVSPYPYVVVHDEVATALAEGRAVVALETTIVVHGLPTPINLEVGAQCESVVRAAGAVPATIGVMGVVARGNGPVGTGTPRRAGSW